MKKTLKFSASDEIRVATVKENGVARKVEISAGQEEYIAEGDRGTLIEFALGDDSVAFTIVEKEAIPTPVVPVKPVPDPTKIPVTWTYQRLSKNITIE